MKLAPARLNALGAFAAYRTSDSSARASTITPADDDQLVVALPASATFVGFAFLGWSCASATPDIRVDFTLPTGATMPLRALWAQGTGATTSAGSIEIGYNTSEGTDDVRGTINGAQTGICPMYVTTSTTAGNLVLRWAQGTSDANGVTLKAGSFILLNQVA